MPVSQSESYMPEATELLRILNERGLYVATAESCTGGNIAHNITLIAGSSSVMLGGVVAYHNNVKMRLLKVERSDLDNYGAVSRQVVEQMARGVCEATGADVGIATSGIAGPGGGSPHKPVGTVWMAAATHDNVVSTVEVFPGDRAEVIEAATRAALALVIDALQ